MTPTAHGRMSAWQAAAGALAAAGLAAAGPAAQAQDIEPRAYSNAPIGVNFLIGGYAYTRGGIAFDSALPAKNPQLTTSNAVLAYARVLDLRGSSGTVSAIVPYTWLSGQAELFGQTNERVVDGFADARFRAAVNLYGAPALSLKEFAAYQQDLIIGASLAMSVPTGQYDSSKLVNIGMNRYSFTAEVGASKAMGLWTLELAGGATFYTDNDDWFNGNTRSQAPLYTVHAHAIYNFPAGLWASLDATWLGGGRTTVNGVRNSDLQQNWRVGGTLTVPLNVRNSIKLYASSGVSSRTGNDYDLVGIAWQVRWGAGL
ncbi:MAG: transporter [Burkholderiales bacterium]|nr:transporter [Burkholderiales bacterium]